MLANAPELIKEYEEAFGPKAGIVTNTGISTNSYHATASKPQTARKQRIWHALLCHSTI